MFCKICGTENIPQALFCENCGAKLTETAANSSEYTPPVTTPDYDISEPVEEEMYEYEEPPKKRKSIKVLIILIVVLAVLVCGAAGVLLSKLLNPEGVGFSDNSSSSGEQQQDDAKDDEDKEEKTQEQIKCENIVKDLMDAVENENTDVIEEHLGFECGDGNALAEKMAKIMADEFDCDYKALEKVSDKMMTEYFHGMESHIKETEKSGGDYIVTVSFTRLDKEAVLEEILKFDAEDYREELVEKYENTEEDSEEALTDDEIEEKVEKELVEKIIKVAEEKIADAKLVTDNLEFVVASDDGEWFIYTDASAFSDLEKELTVED